MAGDDLFKEYGIIDEGIRSRARKIYEESLVLEELIPKEILRAQIHGAVTGRVAITVKIIRKHLDELEVLLGELDAVRASLEASE